MAKKLFCVFTCNEWKERTSFRLSGVYSSLTKLKAAIASGIRNEVFLYNRTDATSAQAQEKQFKADWGKAIKAGDSVLSLLDNTTYLYVDVVRVNENPFV